MKRNSSTGRNSESALGSNRARDVALIVLLVLINPVLWTFTTSVRYFPPDTFQYIEQAERFASDSHLFTEGQGHVDSGTILPPLLPALIALGSFFTDNLLACAEYVSSLSILLAALPLFFLIARASSRTTAFFCVAFLQIHASYYEIALWPLTEALWILMSSSALLVLLILLDRRGPAPWLGVIVGASSALVFFSRQIGLLFVLFSLVAVLTLSGHLADQASRLKSLRIAAISVGFLALFLPYELALFAQTGHHPFKQHFRQGEYLVSATPEDRTELARLQGDGAGGRDYGTVYAGRRAKRKLNASATEMLGYLAIEPASGPGLLGRVQRRLSPRVLATRLIANLNHLRGYLGLGLFALYCLAMLLPIFGRALLGNSVHRIYLVWLWNLTYLVGLSSMTGLIDRYLIGLLPFAIALIGIVSYAVVTRSRDVESVTTRRAPGAIVALALAVSIALTPAFWPSIDRSPKLDVPGIPLDDLRALVHKGEPLFSITPFEAFLVGAKWRTLPNDSLQRISTYGGHTGVHWLLVTRQSSTTGEAALYAQAPWYLDPKLESRPDLPVQLRASYEGGMLLLFELRVPEKR